MIYLIITTSINNRFGLKDDLQRKERYLYAINETLKLLPSEIKPIIVENNGKRDTYLDNFYHNNKLVDVYYTDNNKKNFKNKGTNELLDIQEVINYYEIKDNDIIIKITGRYRVLTPSFFNTILENENNYDAFIKFFGVCSMQFDNNDCVMGYFALRSIFLKLFHHLSIERYTFAETAFTRYIKFSGARINSIENLDLECQFADDNRIINV
jgi:hypothetical protein